MRIPKVSVITVNYNQTQITRELLYSIQRQDFCDLEVIVVDNGSEQNDCDQLSAEFAGVHVLRSDENLGFAGGNNLGIKAAKGNFLFFVNNDTEIPKGTIMDLVNVLESVPESGVVNPLIYFYDQPTITQFAGYTPIRKLTGQNHALGYKKEVKVGNRIIETPYAHGAAMMVKREVIETIGGMPENYFLYYEELDWGQQIRNARYKILVSHRSYILHKESISTGKKSPLKTYFQTRNRILFMRRNYHGLALLTFLLFFLLMVIPKRVAEFVRSRQWQHLKSFQAGVLWHLSNNTDSYRIGYIYDGLRAK